MNKFPKYVFSIKVSDEDKVDLEDESETSSFFTDNVPIVANPLWEMEIRDLVTSSKIPDHQINKMRSELLITVSNDQVNLDDSQISSGILMVSLYDVAHITCTLRSRYPDSPVNGDPPF